eukprot:TRINITY_DN5113_c1_g2_i1.p1 TRINITY_DN5113_c1_g2~~TRINITY_DN5113_c1_g2_i1.p1  ORF type:complete len:1693 (+),score=454.04 TRINITY_DN5113_c1_g2_i1:633-5081(+)
MDALPKGFVTVKEAEEVFQRVRTGNKWRATNAHALNERSSRSHTLFFLTMSKERANSPTTTQSTLLVVDLAGSERVHKTKSTGDTFEEGRAINKALTTLGRVMEGLSKNDRSIPFRENILTMYLKETLTNSFFALVCCCSSDSRDSDETRCTLKFGSVAKQVQITRKTNEMLKARIQAKERKAAFEQTVTNLNEQHEHEKKYLQGKFEQLSHELRSKARERKQLRAELEYSEGERKDLMTSLHTLEQDSSYLQSLVVTLQQESKRKDNLLKKLASEVAEKDEKHFSEIQTLRTTQTDLSNQLTEASTKAHEVDMFRKSNIDLQQRLEIAKDSAINLKQDISMLEAELSDTRHLQQEENLRNESLETNVASLEDVLNDKIIETDLLKSTATNLQTELEGTRHQLQFQHENVLKLENDLLQQEDDTNTLKMTLTDLNLQLTQKEAALTHTEQVVAEERRSKEQLQQHIAECTEIQHQLEKSINERERSIASLVESQRVLQQKAQNLQSSVADKKIIERELHDLRERHSEVSKQVDEQRLNYEQHTKSLERHIDSMERIQSDLQQQLSESKHTREEEVTKLKTAYHEITILVNKEKKRYEEEKRNLQGHVTSLEDTQTTLEAMVTRLERDNLTTKQEGQLLREKLLQLQNQRKKEDTKHQENINYLENIIDNLEHEQRDATMKLTSMREELSTELVKEHDRHREDIYNLEQHLARLQVDFQEMKIAKDDADKKHQHDHERYLNDVRTLETQMENIHAACGSAQRKSEQTQQRYEKDTTNLRSIISELRQEKSQNEVDIARLQDAFQDTQKMVSTLQSEKVSQREELESTIATLQQDAAQLEELIQKVQREHINDVDKLYSENKQITSQVHKYAAEMEELDQTKKDLKQTISQIRSEKDAFQLEVTLQEAEKEELIKSQSNLRNILEKLESDYTKTKQDALDIHEHYMDLEVQLVGEEDEKSRLAETAEHLSNQLQAVSQQKCAFEQKVANLESVAHQLSNKLTMAATARDAATTEVKQLQSTLTNVQNKYQQQLSEIKTAKIRQQELQERVLRAEMLLEKKKVECDRISDELSHQTRTLESAVLLPAEKQALETEVAATKAQLREATTATTKMENELSILLDRHEAAVTLSETQSRRCDQLKVECVSGLQELDNARRSLQSLERSNRRIKLAHQQLIQNTKDLRAKEPDLKNLQNYKKTATQLEQKVTTLSTNNKNLAENAKLEQAESRRLQRELRAKEKEILSLEIKLQQAERQNTALQEQSDTKITQLKRSVSNLSDTVKNQVRSIDRYRGRVRDSERDSCILQHMLTQQESHNSQKQGMGLGVGKRFSTTPVEYFRQRSGSISPGSSSFKSLPTNRSISPLTIPLGRKKTVAQFSNAPAGSRNTYSFGTSPPAVVGRSSTQSYFRPNPQRVSPSRHSRSSYSPSRNRRSVQVAQRHSASYGRPVPVFSPVRSRTPQSRHTPLFVSRVPSRARSASPNNPNAV